MKNRKKGIALPIVVGFMAFIVCFSILLISLVAGSQISIKFQKVQLDKQVVINKMRVDFVDNGQLDSFYDFSYEILENEQNVNQKALVVKKKNGTEIDLYYLFVYDFEQNKVLANQTQNFAISKKQIGENIYYYLAEIIKYKEI